MKKNCKNISFRLDEKIYEQLKYLASLEKVSATKFIEDLITFHGTDIKRDILEDIAKVVKKYE